MSRKGMIASVYRDADGVDCTNGGISSKADRVLIVGEGVPEIFAERSGMPTLLLVDRGPNLPPALYPADDLRPGRFMFGGNFAYSSDSRWPTGKPIKIHDRAED
ncbi:hypothetical protein [Magnetospirillum molischianum]|uniref:Uncharacterized protein n=1 Tax=Magnetospirillum molischianum DSM 120 TaxID=1150626 RepID=H8FXY9_MAGML|nr:hypothetical protein [Magnetospirillum molischianum]CCG43227.1 conserved hypothetical protein [Magnetospirillum molischianum DSM 120]